MKSQRKRENLDCLLDDSVTYALFYNLRKRLRPQKGAVITGDEARGVRAIIVLLILRDRR
jgi:hypothetical protein